MECKRGGGEAGPNQQSPSNLEGGMCCLFQIDQNTAEHFNLTSDGEFNAIKSLVLGKVHGKETGSGFLINTLIGLRSKQVWLLQNFPGFNTAVRKSDLLTKVLLFADTGSELSK